jgi:hypothetical protein
MENEIGEESDSVTSVAETANILTDILRNLIQKPQALRRFVVEDNLFVLLRAFLTKPAIHSDSNLESSIDTRTETTKYDHMWKKWYEFFNRMSLEWSSIS